MHVTPPFSTLHSLPSGQRSPAQLHAKASGAHGLVWHVLEITFGPAVWLTQTLPSLHGSLSQPAPPDVPPAPVAPAAAVAPAVFAPVPARLVSPALPGALAPALLPLPPVPALPPPVLLLAPELALLPLAPPLGLESFASQLTQSPEPTISVSNLATLDMTTSSLARLNTLASRSRPGK